MSTRKISIPQALKAIANERNFFLYQIVDMGEGKKPNKVPAKVGAPYISQNTDKAAKHTLAEVVELRDVYNGAPDKIAKHNENRREYAEQEGKTYRPILRYEVGFVPREDSAAVVVDLDDCLTPEGDLIFDDWSLWGAVESYKGYREVSTSGTGLRMVMPRGFGDDERSDRREANGCAFQARAEQAKGFALTLTGDGPFERDDALLDEVVRVRDEGLRERREEREVDPADMSEVALEFAEYTIDDLESMLASYPNREIERGEWIGLLKAVREAFEPRGLGEAAFDVFDAWTATSEDHGYDPVHNRDRWDEPLDASEKRRTTLASVLKVARERGWRSGAEIEADRAERDVKPEEIERYVLIGGKFYDAWSDAYLDASQMWRLSIDWKMPGIKGNKNVQQNRLGWLASNLPAFDRLEFKPGRARIIEDQVRGAALNTWRPCDRFGQGDGAAPWVDHVRRLFGEDADVLIDWLAFVVQNPGRKAGFAPVLIGPEGCGKDLIVWPVVEAMGDYANPEVKLSIAAGQFGDWLYRKLFCVIQENTRGRFADKAGVAEHFKTLIAAPPERLTIEPKGQRVQTVDNVVNVVFLMNHLDALYIEPGSRRYYPVLTEDKPDREYFNRVWGWLHDGGWKRVVGFLQNKPVRLVSERMDAPRSSAIDAAVAINLPEGAEAVFDYVAERQWVTLQQIKGDLFAADLKFPGQTLPKILKAAGFAKVSNPGADRGRFSVREGGKMVHYTVFARPGVDVTPRGIMEGVSKSPDERDAVQRGASVTPIGGIKIE